MFTASTVTGFTNNISFNSAMPKTGNVLSALRSDSELFRILPFDLTDSKMPFWTKPNANILVNVDSVAAYTPIGRGVLCEASLRPGISR